MNFILREQHYVIKNDMGFVICVIALYGGYLFPFVIKKGRLKRANTDQAAYKAISSGTVYSQLMRQVRAIFGRNKKIVSDKRQVKVLDIKNFTDPSEIERLKALARYRIAILSDGSLVKKRVVDNKDEADSKNIVDQPIPDIDTFIRCQEHITDSFLDKEKGEIVSTVRQPNSIKSAHKGLLDWGTLDSWQKLAVKRELRGTHTDLKRVTNRTKKAIRHNLERITEVKDNQDRTNPSAAAAIGALTIEQFGERIKGSSGIAGYNARLRFVLLKERAQIESNLRLARTATQSLLDSYYRVWEGEEVIIEHINWIISKLRSVWVNPYLRPARYTTALLKEARKVLTEMPVIYLEKGKKTEKIS